MQIAYSPDMKFVDAFVKSPFAGVAPWVLMSLIAGPGRFEEATSAAFGLTLVTMWAGWRRGVRVQDQRRHLGGLGAGLHRVSGVRRGR